MTPAPDRPLIVHYHRPDTLDGWELWIWNDRTRQGGRAVAAGGRDDFGLIFTIDPSSFRDAAGNPEPIGLLPRRGQWEAKDGGDRRWIAGDPHEIWLLGRRPGWSGGRPDPTPFVIGGFLDEPGSVEIELYEPLEPSALAAAQFRIEDPTGRAMAIARVEPAGGDCWIGSKACRLRLVLARPLDLRETIVPLIASANSIRPGFVRPRHLLDRPEFRSDAPLGARLEAGSTVIRVFAPTASRLILHLSDSADGPVSESLEMARVPGGLHEFRANADWSGRWYTLSAEGPDPRFDPSRSLLDPYARMVNRHDGRALIVAERPPAPPGPTFPVDEAIVYELHVRDFTIAEEAGVSAAGLYAGLVEEGTRLPSAPELKTGLDHLLELGVNTIQIMPLHTGEAQVMAGYHWGYMPASFLVPDGSYSAQPAGPARLDELRGVVEALHRRGLKVVLDVVFNHTAERPPGKIWSFEGLAPGYWYRLHADGTAWDGSGTGNELRTEAPMVRRFILNSLIHWIREFGIDGFRFDLMGLIDLDTMKAIGRELRAIRPDIFLWGEPWTAAATPITPTTKGSLRGLSIGAFNDHFRDGLKGDPGTGRGGFVISGGNIGQTRRALEGSIHDFTDRPTESLNYVECHDNRTLWDFLALAGPGAGLAERIRMHRLATAAVLLARGIPFLHSGQEFLRSKEGIDDSWNSGDAINRIDWGLKERHRDVFAWTRDLVHLRRAHPILRRSPGPGEAPDLDWLDDQLHLAVPSPVAAFRLGRGPVTDSWSEAIVILNPAADARDVPLPPGEWRVIVDGDRLVDGDLNACPVAENRWPVPGRSAALLARG